MKFLQIALTAFTVIMSTSIVSSKTVVGKASFYWQDQLTANGEQFQKNDLTAAHRTLPFGTLVRVTHLRNGKQVVVRINDRGPYIKGRIIDLSLGAARQIGLTRKIGVTKVKLEIIGRTKARK